MNIIGMSGNFGGMRKPGFEEYLQSLLNLQQGGQNSGYDPIAEKFGLPPGGPRQPGDPQPHLGGFSNVNDCVDIGDECDSEDSSKSFIPDFARGEYPEDPIAKMYGLPPGGPQRPGDPQPHLGGGQGGPQKPGDPQPHLGGGQGGPQRPGDPQPHLGGGQGGPMNPGDPQPHLAGGPRKPGDPQ